jgi:MFS superfamily sulfate permease-like transporter
MANSVMANLPPINGLYVAFFAVMMYVVFGTSRHLSLGTHGTISLMVGSIVAKYEGVLYPYEEIDTKTDTRRLFDTHGHLLFEHSVENWPKQVVLTANNLTSSFDTSTQLYLSLEPTQAKILIAMCLAFLVGLIQVKHKHFFVLLLIQIKIKIKKTLSQLVFTLLNGGALTKFLSDTVVDAFTTSSSLVIVISQINIMMGFNIKDQDIPFKLLNVRFLLETC